MDKLRSEHEIGEYKNTAYCQCGREATELPPHCRTCGSTNVYALTGDARIIARLVQSDAAAAGTTLTYKQAVEVAKQDPEVRIFKCRRCGSRFRIDTPCDAPPPRELRKAIRAIASQSASRRVDVASSELETAAKAFQDIINAAAAKGETISLTEARHRYTKDLMKGRFSEAKDPRIP
jgi:hypothetical protein